LKKPIVDVDIFRHGEAQYNEGKNVNLYDAKDLTLRGIRAVVINAHKIAKKYTPNTKVGVFTSPYGRTLQTAKLIALVLVKKKIKVELINCEELEESKNLSWPMLKALMTGGEYAFQGKSFYINKNLSNPMNLTYPDFYIEDCISMIDTDTLSSWPKEFVSAISLTEKHSSASKRMITFLNRLRNQYKSFDQDNAVIVTHDSLVIDLVRQASENKQKTLNPGEYVNARIYPTEIVVNLNN